MHYELWITPQKSYLKGRLNQYLEGSNGSRRRRLDFESCDLYFNPYLENGKGMTSTPSHEVEGGRKGSHGVLAIEAASTQLWNQQAESVLIMCYQAPGRKTSSLLPWKHPTSLSWLAWDLVCLRLYDPDPRVKTISGKLNNLTWLFLFFLFYY